ncbi:hypothetical protein [Coleofasciculus sp. G2-EDA-02]|uniref:hypothetical protein n=1 Tax=Coleofasciculus sp. G2-EDA-02 TaxID=3069529 RepID=UPI0032FE45D8
MQRLGAGGASFVNFYEAQLGITCCAIASFPLSSYRGAELEYKHRPFDISCLNLVYLHSFTPS